MNACLAALLPRISPVMPVALMEGAMAVDKCARQHPAEASEEALQGVGRTRRTLARGGPSNMGCGPQSEPKRLR
eukprot:3941197-Alexandrium_andersonii.AAC.1